MVALVNFLREVHTCDSSSVHSNNAAIRPCRNDWTLSLPNDERRTRSGEAIIEAPVIQRRVTGVSGPAYWLRRNLADALEMRPDKRFADIKKLS